jgi:hypothetical protein
MAPTVRISLGGPAALAGPSSVGFGVGFGFLVLGRFQSAMPILVVMSLGIPAICKSQEQSPNWARHHQPIDYRPASAVDVTLWIVIRG